MRSATFRNIALGILALAVSYHLGARTAGAQAGSMVSGFVGTGDIHSGSGDFFVLTPNGDFFARRLMSNGANGDLIYIGNFWSGGPIPVQQESWGALKSRYRGERGAAQPTQDR